MAPLTFLLFFTSSLLSPTLSRTVSTHSTTIFDVSASTKRAQNALSIDPFKSKLHPSQFHTLSPNSSFSLPLHPRLALHKPPYKDYRTLVRARLARDAARVQSLNQNLHRALNLPTPGSGSASEIRPDAISIPVTSGLSQGSGEYFARLGVGQPAQSFALAPDTGSDITWLQCLPCDSGSCYKQVDPIFDPSSSSSYESLPCGSQQCQSLDGGACASGTCQYQVSYGDGSFTAGEFATETLSFGDSKSIPNIAIGCGHDNEGLFTGAAGLIGLGGAALSLPSQMKASSFSYCLVDRDSDSSSTLDFNSGPPGNSVTSPLLVNKKFKSYRYVAVTGLNVGGQALPIPSTRFEIDGSGEGGIIVDSGTTITRLPSDVYGALRDAFAKLTGNLPPAEGVSPFDTCYDLSSQTNVDVPTVSFQLPGGKTLELPAKNFMIPVDSAGTFCLAFLPTTRSLSIIGNVQQQGIRVSYDLVNSLVAFSSNQC